MIEISLTQLTDIILFILLFILSFRFFFNSLYKNQGFVNNFTWPVAIILFFSLSFFVYSIETSMQKPISLFMILMAILSIVLFLFDIFDKFNPE